MATKDISRSATEGGRHNHNKYRRRQSSRDERTDVRAFVSKTLRAIDPDEVSSPAPKRQPVMKEFDDKLNAMKRFLETCVGRPWRLVYSEIREKYDSRTTAGRHILFDHLLSDISGAGQQEMMHKGKTYSNYYIDRNGILRESPDRSKRKHCHHISVDWAKVCVWLKGRKLGLVGDNRLFWFVPVNGEAIAQYGQLPGWLYSNNGIRYFKAKDGELVMERPMGYLERPAAPVMLQDTQYGLTRTAWRQSEAASVADVEYFNKLPLYAREQLLANSPTNKAKKK